MRMFPKKRTRRADGDVIGITFNYYRAMLSCDNKFYAHSCCLLYMVLIMNVGNELLWLQWWLDTNCPVNRTQVLFERSYVNVGSLGLI